MMIRSNVTCTSNVYELKGDFLTDREFQSMVRGHKSLQQMVKHLRGLAWVSGGVSRDKYEGLLTPVQKQELELGMYCALLGDREELVWGLIRDREGYRVVCRCYRTGCRHFARCRPDYVPGAEPVFQAPSVRDNYPVSREDASAGSPWQLGEMDIVPEIDRDTGMIEIDIGEEPELPFLSVSDVREEDDPQANIILGEASDMMLVLAGPGTGKTYALLRKLEYMVDEKRMVEADTILLLCFTRAAVREIRERFFEKVKSGAYSDDLSRLDIRTFDSFATRLLVYCGVDAAGLDYDARIERAIEQINSNPDLLENMKHFIVDEIQDLVGVRACLVQAILDNRPSGCGFTLLGDPLQAIYDYEVKDRRDELDSRGLLQWVHERYGDELKIVNLTYNRRQSVRLAAYSARSRSLLQTEEPGMIREFFESVNNIPLAGIYSHFVPQCGPGEKVAVLCRNNGETLKVSGYMRQRGITHTVRTHHTRWLFPVWVADLLASDRRLLTRDDLAAIDLTEWGPQGDPDRLFTVLQGLTGSEGRTADVESIRRILAGEARLPDELYEGPACPLTVSTIHRAKGREFDRVYLLRPRDSERIDDLLDEARVYYVGITRARTALLVLERVRTFTWLKLTDSGRWVEQGKKRDGKPRLVGVETGLDSDVDEESFVDTLVPEFDPLETQRYIRTQVAAGDPLQIERLDGESLCYGIYHRGRLIGRMSERFTAGVRDAMNFTYGWTRHVPCGFSEVYVERVYSAVRKPETMSLRIVEPYISTGVWYAANPVGMGKVRFEFD